MIDNLKNFWEIGRNKIDLPLLYSIIFLSFLGLGILFSASSVTAAREFGDSSFYFKKQAIWTVISFIFFIIAIIIPYKIYQKYAIYILLFSITLLTLVFIPGIGKSVDTHYGRNFHRWINLGGYLQFQPSEFAKMAVVVYIASFLTKWNHLDSDDYKTLLIPAISVASVIILVLTEPAFGTSMEIFFLVLGLVFLNGFPLKNLLIGFLSVVPLTLLLVYKVGYRKKRIEVWLNPYKYRFDEGHQLVSSFRSFIEGSWIGNSLSTGYAHRYLAYSHTDFVLATFVEDYGFIGFLFLSAIFLFIIIRCYRLLNRVKDFFGFLVGSGLLIMISLQFLMNTFVVTGIMPITGISLPFVSYGGSSLLVIMISFGIFLNITNKDNIV